ncbi:MAG: LPS export ABC transporter permease LptF [Desulfosalsimonadaceae bacterium]|nr:LPS export ABC transporter permease LptF [Desulfosalsimonadaceae bacterium]
MKLNSIVHRYIFRELIPPFIMNLVFFMFVFLMRQILEITHVIVNYQVGVLAFFLMLAYSMPYFFSYIIPMSVMMSVLLTFLKLSNDNEIVALKAGGISLYHLLPPVIAFSVLSAILAAGMSIYGIPWGQQAYKEMALQVVQSNFNVGLKERQFIDSFDGVMFYVNKIDLKTNALTDIYIEDQRTEGLSSTIVAPKGIIFSGEDKYSFILSLYNGTINQVDVKNDAVYATKFDTYELRLDLKDAMKNISQRQKKEKEMHLEELIAFLKTGDRQAKKYLAVTLELHKKFSIPFACIALGILAVPLGVASSATRKTAGLGIGLIAFLFYYLLLSAGLVFGEAGSIPPGFGMWMPNGVMGGLGLYLLVRTANDRPLEAFNRIGRLTRRLFTFYK